MSSTPAPRRYRWTILAAGVLAQAAFSAILLGLPSVAPAIEDEYELSLTQLGVVLGAINFGSLATMLLWGVVADRIGERAVIAFGQAGAAAALVWAAYSSTYAELVAALAVAGALGSGVNAASGRAVMAWFGADERGLALGIRQMAVPLGGATAAVGLPLLNHQISLRAAFVGLAVGCLVSAAIGVILIRTEPAQEEEHSLLARPFRDPRIWLICTASTFYVTTQIALLSFFVLFLHDRGVSTAVAAGGLAVAQVLGGAARIAVGRWSDRLRLRIVPWRWMALALAASVAAIPVLLDAPVAILLPALVLAGTISMAWNGLAFTATAETAGLARSGAALGLQQTFLSAGSLVAPIAFATAIHQVSWRAAFVLAAISPLIGYALLSPLRERRP